MKICNVIEYQGIYEMTLSNNIYNGMAIAPKSPFNLITMFKSSGLVTSENGKVYSFELPEYPSFPFIHEFFFFFFRNFDIDLNFLQGFCTSYPNDSYAIFKNVYQSKRNS